MKTLDELFVGDTVIFLDGGEATVERIRRETDMRYHPHGMYGTDLKRFASIYFNDGSAESWDFDATRDGVFRYTRTYRDDEREGPHPKNIVAIALSSGDDGANCKIVKPQG